MFRARRTSVYEVYDEDAFLAAPDGDQTAALSGAPLPARKQTRRSPWARAIVVAAAAGGGTLLVASLVDRHRPRPSARADHHAAQARRGPRSRAPHHRTRTSARSSSRPLGRPI